MHTLEKRSIESSLVRRWNRIYSPVHSLAFACDPTYFKLRQDMGGKYGIYFIGLGNEDINLKCHEALRSISSCDDEENTLLNQFMELCMTEERTLQSLKDFSCFRVWSQ